MEDKVTINGTEYAISPLRCKHLREISKLVKDESIKKSTDFTAVEKWMPFIFDAIRSKNPEFTQAILDEATLQEFNDAWKKIVEISGVQMVKVGETKPASIGDSSTGESPLAAV